MSATILTPVNLALTNAYADLMTAPAAGKVRKVDVRFANVGSADGFGFLQLTNGVTTINRANNYPVSYQNVGSAPDIEQGFVIPAGWKLQAKADASGKIEASVSGVEADASDLT